MSIKVLYLPQNFYRAYPPKQISGYASVRYEKQTILYESCRPTHFDDMLGGTRRWLAANSTSKTSSESAKIARRIDKKHCGAQYFRDFRAEFEEHGLQFALTSGNFSRFDP